MPGVEMLAKGLPVSLLRGGAMALAEDATLLVRGFLKNLVDEACDLAHEPAADVLLEALWQRVRQAPQLVEEYLLRVESRP
ncbi:MAG: hypothetical protein L0Y64_27060 [Myxococcaceae bacterium]|nr:hypothetical protein [Myxococcaceae bacterium]